MLTNNNGPVTNRTLLVALLSSSSVFLFTAFLFRQKQDIETAQAFIGTTTAFISAIIFFIRSINAAQSNQAQVDVQREQLLATVHRKWLHEYIMYSLGDATPIELELDLEPRNTKYHKEIIKTLPPLTSQHIFDVYQNMGQRLVISGGEKCGKTTLALQLLKNLHERTKQKADEPIPIVLNFHDWQIAAHPNRVAHLLHKLRSRFLNIKPATEFENWLIRQIHTDYDIPHSTVRQWLHSDSLVIMVDNFDVTHQRKLQAVKAYLKNSFVPMVLCAKSNSASNEPSDAALKELGIGLVKLKLPTSAQINRYLTHKNLHSLMFLQKRDDTFARHLEKLEDIGLLSAAYHGCSVGELALVDAECREDHIARCFVQKSIRFSTPDVFSTADIIDNLGWLARWMKATGEKVISTHPKHLLKTVSSKSKPYWLLYVAIIAIAFLAITALSYLFPAFTLIGIGAFSSFTVCLLGLDLFAYFTDSSNRVQDYLWFLLVFGGVSILGINLIPLWFFQDVAWQGQIISLVIGILLIFILVRGTSHEIRIYENPRQYWVALLLLTCYSIALLIDFLVPLKSNLLLIIGVILSGLTGVAVVSLLALNAPSTKPYRTVRSWKDFWHTQPMAIILGLTITSILILVAAFSPASTRASDSVLGQTTLGFFIIFVLLAPASAYRRRYGFLKLTLMLVQSLDNDLRTDDNLQALPPQYVACFKYAAQLQLLHQVGDGYQFRHQLLQDYFAKQRNN